MPPGFLSTHNTSSTGGSMPYTPFLGAYAEGRMQVISADWTGGSAVSVTSISLRRDTEYYYPSNHGNARSWADVSVTIGESSYSGVSSTFSANMTTTPTAVFNKTTSWGDTSAKPSSTQSWGGFNMSFPFTSPYAWSRAKDVCIDFRFTGGRLANNGSWTGVNYVLVDGFSDRIDNGPYYNFLVTAACKSPGQNAPGFFGSNIRTLGPLHSTNPNTLSIDIFQALGAPLTNHIGAIGLIGSFSGVNIGTCEKLYLLHTPVPFSLKTSLTGTWFLPRNHIPFTASSVGIVVYSQSAYTHPVTQAFALSGGVRSVVPALPNVSGFKQVQVNASDRTSATGTLSMIYVPILKLN